MAVPAALDVNPVKNHAVDLVLQKTSEVTDLIGYDITVLIALCKLD